jgi:hypothetical protein
VINVNKIKPTIYRGSKIKLDIPFVDNPCEIDIPYTIANIPDWLCISEEDEKKVFVALKKSTSSLRMIITVPQVDDDGPLEAAITLKKCLRPHSKSEEELSTSEEGLVCTIRLFVVSSESLEVFSVDFRPGKKPTSPYLMLEEILSWQVRSTAEVAKKDIKIKYTNRSNSPIHVSAVYLRDSSAASFLECTLKGLRPAGVDLKPLETYPEVLVSLSVGFGAITSRESFPRCVPSNALPSSSPYLFPAPIGCVCVRVGEIVITTTSASPSHRDMEQGPDRVVDGQEGKEGGEEEGGWKETTRVDVVCMLRCPDEDGDVTEQLSAT